jgi:hypothetical protein
MNSASKAPRARLSERSMKRAPPCRPSAFPPLSVRPSPWRHRRRHCLQPRRIRSIIVREGLDASPVHEVLVEESVLGWKEYEMEVVRDRNDNCIIICSIENIDPMGVHTGDSITVAPALTLTDKEYQIMRDASLPCCAVSALKPADQTSSSRSIRRMAG